LEVNLATYVGALEIIAEGSGAAAWNLATSAFNCRTSLTLPQTGIDQVFGTGPDVVFAGSGFPTGVASRTVGGFAVTGRWRFGSGCEHADWLVGSGRIASGGTSEAIPEQRSFFFRPEQATIVDTWHVLGMRGTGSHDWSVESQFVPEAFSQVFRSPIPRTGTFYRFTAPVIANLHFSAVATGIARCAIDAFAVLAGLKTPDGRVSGLLRERVQAQEAVALAHATLESARTYRESCVASSWEMMDREGNLTMEQQWNLRLAGTYAAQSAVKAVELVFTVSGTSGIEEENALSRCLRDVRVVAQSIAVQTVNYEQVGRAMLGLEPTGPTPL
jgi:alkylation response protein AidB-like acyl-CoA dehydrogenase